MRLATRAALLVCVLARGQPTEADPLYDRAAQKIDIIISGSPRPGSIVTLTEAELNAWARVRVPELAKGIYQPKVVLGESSVNGSALIDFVKFRQGEGIKTNPALTWLIDGERPVSVTAQVVSAHGKATVNPTKIELNGVPISGGALDTMIRTFLLPMFPDTKINRPFALRENIDHIDIRRGLVKVFFR